MEVKTFADLEEEYDAALAAYNIHKQEASAARSRETDSLTRLNSAQKAFDARLADVKKKAPRATEWKRAERSYSSAPVNCDG